MTMKKDNKLELSASTVAYISCRRRLSVMLAGIRGRREVGMWRPSEFIGCHTLLPFLTYIFYQIWMEDVTAMKIK